MWDDILLYVIIGFVAQMIDGAIGMAYGVTASSVLLSLGVPPATASACVHAAETFTTGASGFAHWRLGNVDRKLLVRLAVPGMIGGAIGAYVLSELPGDTLRPFISAYLLLLGVFIVWKALATRPIEAPAPRAVAPLGLFGGVLDAIEPEPTVSLHPHTIRRLGLEAGGWARVSSRRGAVRLRVRADDGIQPHVAFIPFAYVEAAANLLTIDALDPQAKIPEFKYCAVRVTRGGKAPEVSSYGGGPLLDRINA
jgi:formylmethanofuran dehydrogenase subunit D